MGTKLFWKGNQFFEKMFCYDIVINHKHGDHDSPKNHNIATNWEIKGEMIWKLCLHVSTNLKHPNLLTVVEYLTMLLGATAVLLMMGSRDLWIIASESVFFVMAVEITTHDKCCVSNIVLIVNSLFGWSLKLN